MKILLTFFISLCLIGCKSDTEYKIDAMKKPITIRAISKDGDIVLVDANGEILILNSSFYIAKAIHDSYKVGEVFIP